MSTAPKSRRLPTICYRTPAASGPPLIGAILMGEGKRVRRAYRIISATKVKSRVVRLGVVSWKLRVEPISAAEGRDEIAAGMPWQTIQWDKRERRRV